MTQEARGRWLVISSGAAASALIAAVGFVVQDRMQMAGEAAGNAERMAAIQRDLDQAERAIERLQVRLSELEREVARMERGR